MPKYKKSRTQYKAHHYDLVEDLSSYFDDREYNQDNYASDEESDEYDEDHGYSNPIQKSKHKQSSSSKIFSNPLSEEEYKNLFYDEFHRFKPSSRLIGHALINVSSNTPQAKQFTPPALSDGSYPEITHLNNISLFVHDNHYMATATAEDGTQMLARHAIDLKIKNKRDNTKSKYQLLLFSPSVNRKMQAVPLGNLKKAPLFKTDLSPRRLERKRKLEQLPTATKGGKVTLDAKSIYKRESTRRKPSQTRVMKQSALEAYQEYYDEYQDILSEEMKTILQSTIDAGRDPHKEKQKPEWLHALGYRLTPLSQNPQQASNLAAGNHHSNTEMNVTERVLYWHTKNCKQEKQTAKAQFKLLPNSDLLDEGYIKGKFKNAKYSVRLKQQVTPWTLQPNYYSISDIAQTVLATRSILDDVAVDSETVSHTQAQSTYLVLA